MKNVIFDLDDVVCELSVPFHAALTKATGRNIPVAEWHDFNLGLVYGVSLDEVFEVLRRHRVIEQARPYGEARELLGGLMAGGYDIHIVSSRYKLDPEGEVTREWLERHQIPHSSLTITCHTKGKADVAQSLNPVLMVDDHSQNIIDCAPFVEQAVLVNRPWNLKFDAGAISNLKRVDGLSGVAELVSGRC